MINSSFDYSMHATRYPESDQHSHIRYKLEANFDIMSERLEGKETIRKWRTLSWLMVVCRSNRRSEWVSGEETNREIVLDIADSCAK